MHVEQATGDRTTPLIVVPATDIRGTYRGLADEPTLHIDPTTLLDEVAITPELVRIGLGHAIPLVAKSAWFDGRVSVALEAIDVPLGQIENAKGKSRITLHQVRSGPTDRSIIDLLSIVAAVRGSAPQLELIFIDGSVIDIALEGGRVFHEGLRLGLPKVDPRLQLATRGASGSRIDRLT